MSVKKSCIFLLFSTVTFSLIFLFLKLTDVRTVHSFQALTDRFFSGRSYIQYPDTSLYSA